MKAILIIGGNIGNRQRNLQQAAELIEQKCGPIVQSSALYETEPWGNSNQQEFLNQVLIIETALEPEELLDSILTIELTMGRIREEKNGPRIIDIDILFYENEVVNTATLNIPHPEMARRRFVLEPLSELAPLLLHPVLNKTISQLLLECSDPLAVNKLS